MLRFTLSGIQGQNITIPSGTRATPDGLLYFVTKTDLVITAGAAYGDAIAEAAEHGTKYNGFNAGQIKNIVDPVAFVSSVSNTDTSQGGSDSESDDDYRLRIRLAPESFSVAGPSGAYEYWARTADESISSVSVSSPSVGTVKVVVLLEGGLIPGQSILNKVQEILTAKDRRPLTDNVIVQAPSEASYNITLTYYIDMDRKEEEAQIRALIENAEGVVDQYIDWQCSVLGLEINPDELRRRMLEAGAYRITLTSPGFTTINSDQVATIGTKTITYGGLI
jgi:phage-related baseplate assembly protein